MGAVETSQPFTTAAGKLTRVLTALTNGALTFAGVGVFAGLFSLYGFAVSSVGGVEFWGWPLVELDAAHAGDGEPDRKSTRLNSRHQIISYPVFFFKKKKHI